jgi:hypothetical protein
MQQSSLVTIMAVTNIIYDVIHTSTTRATMITMAEGIHQQNDMLFIKLVKL